MIEVEDVVAIARMKAAGEISEEEALELVHELAESEEDDRR